MLRHPLTPIAAALFLLWSNAQAADKTLGEVTVSNARSVGSKPGLRDEIIATESFSARDIEKSGATTLTEALDKPAMWPQGLAVYSRRAGGAGQAPRWHRMPDDPAAVAHELFAVLRQLDDEGVAEIWVEQPPDQPAWEGVLDRLRRAATP